VFGDARFHDNKLDRPDFAEGARSGPVGFIEGRSDRNMDLTRSHGPRGNAFPDAPRPVDRRGACDAATPRGTGSEHRNRGTRRAHHLGSFFPGGAGWLRFGKWPTPFERRFGFVFPVDGRTELGSFFPVRSRDWVRFSDLGRAGPEPVGFVLSIGPGALAPWDGDEVDGCSDRYPPECGSLLPLRSAELAPRRSTVATPSICPGPRSKLRSSERQQAAALQRAYQSGGRLQEPRCDSAGPVDDLDAKSCSIKTMRRIGFVSKSGPGHRP
jgi:hypothetical protein